MTSIYDIPYKDIKEFLLANNSRYVFENEDDAYDKALLLLKNKNSKGHTISIIEWMIAHNLLISKINIPNYDIDEIDKMSRIEINKLAKLLTMKGNNPNNIKNILRYLNKLGDKNITLLPEVNDIILNILYDIERKDEKTLLLIQAGYSDQILHLLKKHHNKQMIRELILDNMEEVVGNLIFEDDYNFLILFIIRLLEHDELGLAKRFYDYSKLLDPDWRKLTYKVIDQINNVYDSDIVLERLFKIIPSEDLFHFFTEKVKNIKNINYRLSNLYIPFLRTAIKLQEFNLIISILDHFNKKSLENFKKVSRLTNNLIKELEDLIVIAKEMI